MNQVLLDGAVIDSRAALHDTLQQALALPEYYGRNLDALFDCLTDLHTPTQITLRNAALLKEQLGYYASSLLIVLRRAAQENDAISLLVEPQIPEEEGDDV